MSTMSVLIVAGNAKSLIGFRRPLLQEMRRSGIEVSACAAEDDSLVRTMLASWDVVYVAVPLQRTGLNPFSDHTYRYALGRIIDEMRPDVVLAYTHKPVIYSALAAVRSSTKPRVYALITGLGFGFVEGGGFKQRLVGTALRFLYRLASRHFDGIIFQNPDDQALFRNLKLIRPKIAQIVVRGSGVDLTEFSFAPLSDAGCRVRDDGSRNVENSQPSAVSSPPLVPRFLLIARLLVDKGIREYVGAARIIKEYHPEAEFHLVGPTDPNPTAIKLSEVEACHREGVIVYHGAQDDVRPLLRNCTVYVLPTSYREGTPRSVLEAMATGRAVITTDAPGCRETIFNAGSMDADEARMGDNGFLVPVKSVRSLAAAMRRFIEQPELAVTMGEAGRRLAEEHYDVNKVNRQMLQFMGLSTNQ